MLALALSVDSLASGFGMGLGSVSILKTAVIVFVGGLIAIYGGSLLGRKAKSKIRPDLSWLGGIIMIALAVSKLFYFFSCSSIAATRLLNLILTAPRLLISSILS